MTVEKCVMHQLFGKRVNGHTGKTHGTEQVIQQPVEEAPMGSHQYLPSPHLAKK